LKLLDQRELVRHLQLEMRLHLGQRQVRQQRELVHLRAQAVQQKEFLLALELVLGQLAQPYCQQLQGLQELRHHLGQLPVHQQRELVGQRAQALLLDLLEQQD